MAVHGALTRSTDALLRSYLLASVAVLCLVRSRSPSYRPPRLSAWARFGLLVSAVVIGLVILSGALLLVTSWMGPPDRHASYAAATLRAVTLGSVLNVLWVVRRRRAHPPADSDILAQAGWGPGHIFVSRQVVPAVLSSAVALVTGGLVILVGSWRGTVQMALVWNFALLAAVVCAAALLRLGVTWRMDYTQDRYPWLFDIAIGTLATGMGVNAVIHVTFATTASGDPGRALLSWMTGTDAAVWLIVLGVTATVAAAWSVCTSRRWHP